MKLYSLLAVCQHHYHLDTTPYEAKSFESSMKKIQGKKTYDLIFALELR